MANNKFKVEIPRDPTEALALLALVLTKHTTLAAASPLNGLKWAEITPDLAEAQKQDQLSDDLRRKAEKATGERDKHMGDIVEFIRSARDVLMGLNRDNPDALGDFGFKVSDAAPAAAKPAVVVTPH